MSTWEIPGPAMDEGGEVLRAVRLVSAVDRVRRTQHVHRVRLGLRSGDYTSWLGTWDQASHNLNKGESRSILDTRHVNKQIRDGEGLVIEVRKTGTPDEIHGTSVHFEFAPVGGRGDGVSPLVATDTANLDPISRNILNDVILQVNQYGAIGRRDTVHLTEPIGTVAVTPTVAIYDDEDTTQRTVSSTSYADGNVSVDVALSDTAIKVYVLVVASATVDSSSGASTATAYLAIGDGTSEHNEKYAECTRDGDEKTIATSYAAEITEDTTFITRFKQATTNVHVERQSINVLQVEVYA